MTTVRPTGKAARAAAFPTSYCQPWVGGAVTAGSRNTVKLEWVVHEGRDTHVTAFAGLPTGSRPVVSCPECGERLVLRLGQVRVWHAAHHKGGECALSESESALHHNTKMYLADKMRSVSSVVVVEPCIGTVGGIVANGCKGTRSRQWVQGWTSVAVERSVQTRRPDLVLLDGQKVVGAVEVWVSHRVEKDKRDLYASWEMPWVEVAASEELIEGESAWNPQQPLPVASIGPEAAYTCNACLAFAKHAERELAAAAELRRRREAERQASEEAWKARQAELKLAQEVADREEKEERAAFRRRAQSLRERMSSNGVLIQRIRVFDRLFAGGTVMRDALVIADVYKAGAKVGAFLGVSSDLAVIQKVGANTGRDGYQQLARQADDYLTALQDDNGAVDTMPSWFPLMCVLDDDDFFKDWSWEGKEHQWQSEAGPPQSPWRVGWADEGVDCLDLLRFFFVRYLRGLPLQFRWSEKNQGWFQPAILKEDAWRLWPADLETRPRGRR